MDDQQNQNLPNGEPQTPNGQSPSPQSQSAPANPYLAAQQQPQASQGMPQPQQQPQAAQDFFGRDAQQPAAPNQPFANQVYGQQPSQMEYPGQFAQPTNDKKKKVVLFSAVGLVVLLLGSSAAAYFGYLVPNKPENVWATALDRTAVGYDKLTDYQKDAKDLTSGSFKGDYKLAGVLASDGSFEGKFDEKNLAMTADLGAVTTRLNLDVRLIDSAASSSPDVYFKVKGIKGFSSILGDSSGFIDKADNQWYVADHTLIDTVASNAGTGAVTPDVEQLSNDDVVAIMKAVGEVNREYLLSTDDGKKVLTVVQSVGKEKQDDRDVYHFKVGLDKQHTKDYLNALVTKLDTTPVTKLLDGKKLKDEINLDDMLKSVDKYNSSDTADVFVDMESKTIRTVRFSDKTDPKNYLDIGVHYTGGDVVPFVIGVHTEDKGGVGTLTFNWSTNLKTNESKLKLDFDFPSSSEQNAKREKGNMNMTLTMGKDAVKVDKPAGAKSINELVGPLLGGSSVEDLSDPSTGGLDPSSLLGGRISI